MLQADAQRDRWANEFAQQPDQWANEFERTQTGATASISGQDQAQAASQGDTKALADFLGKDANPKMKKSKFLQFISKMSRGEIILEDNQVGLMLKAVRVCVSSSEAPATRLAEEESELVMLTAARVSA